MCVAARKLAIKCQNCGMKISLGGSPSVDQRFACTRCGDVHKVVSLEPMQIEWAWEDLLEGPQFSVRSWRFRGRG